MEENGRKIIECLKVILYVIMILLMCYITITNYISYTMKKDYYLVLKTGYKVLEKINSILVENNDSLNKEIEDIKNIDTLISETKENVFKLASLTEHKIQEGYTNYKIAYITFDDGPYYLTNNVLNVLRNKKVKATFFTIGRGKEECYDNKGFDCTTMYAKEAMEGHTVANHTYSHAINWGLYSSTSEFINQINIQDNLIKEKTGIKPNIMRFPGGSGTARGLRDDIINNLRSIGYGWVDWTAQDGDGGSLSSTSQAWNTFVNSINSGIEVVLFHDYSNITYSILPDAIDYLEGNNYILLPLFYDSVMVNK